MYRFNQAWLEMPRALMESAMLAPAAPLLMTVPRGDGHPVLVIPGLLGHDHHMLILRRYLDSRSYRTHGWLRGTNRGLSAAGGMEVLQARLNEIYQRYQGRKVSIIGWSLGGIFARRLAMMAPDQVRQVICLGSPIGSVANAEAAVIAERFRDEGLSLEQIQQMLMLSRHTLPVPSTAVYSRSDAIVPHQIAAQPASSNSESIEVIGSHAGLIVNPQVLYLLGRRLCQPEDNWQPLAA